METVYAFYDIFPKVIPVGVTKTITIKPLDRHCDLKEDEVYIITVVPTNHITADEMKPDYPSQYIRAKNNQLQFSVTCEEEQEYCIYLRKEGETYPGPLWDSCSTPICVLHLYALAQDLFGLLPLKGNMHAHSFRSDGVESPELVAANYRRAGFDFLAITDHELYQPSLEAIDAFSSLELDFKLYPGEEIHAPHNKIHILGFAGDQSVNDFYRDHPDLYEKEVAEITKELSLSESHEDFEYASSVWVFRKIREFGGLSILAHPNWMIAGSFNIPPSQYRTFLKERPFDALELINGGDTPYENSMQTAIWHDACCQGCCVPVVGNDDSHGTVNGEWFNIGMTYVLAGSNSREDLFEAIRAGRCIAVERYHNEAPRYYGSSRLIAFFAFLDRCYFPLHDEICAQEGYFLTEFLRHNPVGVKGLQALQGEIKRLEKKYLFS